MFKTIASMVIAGLLVLGVPAVSSASVPGSSTCAKQGSLEATKLDTFKIDLDLGRRVRRPGDVLAIKALVTRKTPAGIEPSPAEGVSLTAALTLGEMYLVGYGVTGDDGRATLKIKTWNNAPTGWSHLRFIARKRHVETPCHEEVVEETLVKLRNAIMFH